MIRRRAPYVVFSYEHNTTGSPQHYSGLRVQSLDDSETDYLLDSLRARKAISARAAKTVKAIHGIVTKPNSNTRRIEQSFVDHRG